MKANRELEIPLLPKVRNAKYDVEGTLLLWNLLPEYFTWGDFEVYTALVNHSTSWGYERLAFWVDMGLITRIKQGEYHKRSH